MPSIAYISGPMSGYKDYNREAFTVAEANLKEVAYFDTIINPAALDEGEQPWEYYLTRDLKMIMDAKVTDLILLPGWMGSKGARAELFIAQELRNAQIYQYTELERTRGFILTPCNHWRFDLHRYTSVELRDAITYKLDEH